MMIISTVLIAAATVVTLWSIATVLIATRRARARRPQDETAPAVTVLKPLKGADDALEGNLATFFEQDYPDFELLFGVEGKEDPAIAVVRRLQARYPHVRSRLVLHDGGRAINPKVSNLLAMMETETEDVVVISDSNVAVRPDYLRAMAGQLLEPGVGLVTNPIAGTGEQTLGATLENLQLAGPIVGSVAASSLAGKTFAIGKSLMFRRSVFDKLGGMVSLATVLAEDYVMGRMFQAAGYRVALCPEAIDNVSVTTTVSSFFKRHMRWGLLRSRLQPLLYPLELLANPMGVALLVLLLGGPAWALLWGAGLTLLRDVVQWLRLRGSDGLLAAVALGPLKDLMMLGAWVAAPFQRHITWRGRRYRVSAGTRLYSPIEMDAPRELQVELSGPAPA